MLLHSFVMNLSAFKKVSKILLQNDKEEINVQKMKNSDLFPIFLDFHLYISDTFRTVKCYNNYAGSRRPAGKLNNERD